jgi:hypothetical protein
MADEGHEVRYWGSNLRGEGLECASDFDRVGRVVDQRHTGFEDAGFLGGDGLQG